MKLNKTYYTICVYALLGAAVVALFAVGLFHFDRILGALSFVFEATKGLTYGIVIAISVCPMYLFLHRRVFAFTEKKKKHPILRKVLAMTLTYLLVLIFLIVVVSALLPEIERTYTDLSSGYSVYLSSAQSWLDSFFSLFKDFDLSFHFQRGEKVPVSEIRALSPDLFREAFHFGIRSGRGAQLAEMRKTVWGNGFHLDLSEMFQSLLSRLVSALSSAAPTLLSALNKLLNEVRNILLGVMISVYFLASKDRIKAMLRKLMKALLPDRVSEKIREIGSISYRVFVEYLAAKVLDAFIMTNICFVLFSLFKIPHPLLISTTIGFLNVIPFLGPIVGTLIGSVFVFLFAPSRFLLFLITVIAVHQVDAHLIEPRILGKQEYLSDFWSITAVVVTGSVFGIAGYFFGVPLFSVFAIRFREYLDKAEEKKKNAPASQ